MLDVFNSDAFSVTSLTDAVNKLPFVPGRLGEIGLFEAKRVNTTTIAIEEKENTLVFLSPIPRGAPGQTIDKVKRKVRNLTVPHYEILDAIYADEVQNIRPFGQETGLETVLGKVAERLRDTHLPAHAATEELARIGAIKGIVTYADGSTLNLFTEFEVSAESDIDFDLDNASPASGALRTKCSTTIRKFGDLLGDTRFRYIHAMCSDGFYDAIIAHPEVVASYTGTEQAAELRRAAVEGTGSSYGSFWFGGIKFENYRGTFGGSPLIAADTAQLFPVGVPSLFRSVFAPADYNETVDTMGKRLYVKQKPMYNDKGYHLNSQMNALHICTRPKVLIKATKT